MKVRTRRIAVGTTCALLAIGIAAALWTATVHRAATDLGKSTQATLESATRATTDTQRHSAPPSAVLTTQAPASTSLPGTYDPTPPPAQPTRGDRFTTAQPNPVRSTREAPISTFSSDVDTAAYAYIRASLNRGRLPPRAAVRIEEMINYFDYADTAPQSTGEAPFAIGAEIVPAPWRDGAALLHLAITARSMERTAPATLVFLVDTSGSMNAVDKMPLLVGALRTLIGGLAPDDRVAIVTYAGTATVALEPTPVAEQGTIMAALDTLHTGGGTAGAAGIVTAYRLAERHRTDATNARVILATDGDFNIGAQSPSDLLALIEAKRKTGIALTVLGFGMGNYTDTTMQTLAQAGNGNAAYIDTLDEARKVLVDEGASTLTTIASDVKIQVEFNPARIAEYRLIGYETRQLAREDFTNDRVDAGDIGPGHRVRALYEIVPAGSDAARIEPRRYNQTGSDSDSEPESAERAKRDLTTEHAFVKVRYKVPGASESRLITRPVTDADAHATLGQGSDDARFASAVAGFGELLRGGKYTGQWGYDEAATLASAARGQDAHGYRAELVRLVRTAASLASTAAH